MCIAIYKPAGQIVPMTHLEESFLTNPDGAGFAVSKNNKLIISKGFFTLDDFMFAYEPYETYDCLLHFRIATSGGVSDAMCHPFPLLDGKYALIHNGIINIKNHEGKSDTATFVDAVLTPMLKQGVSINSGALGYIVERAIGKFNKIVVMDESGFPTFFNENEGHYKDHVWYSNYTYLPPVYTKWVEGKKWNEQDWNRDYEKYYGIKKTTGPGTYPASKSEDSLYEILCPYCDVYFNPEYSAYEDCCVTCGDLLFEAEPVNSADAIDRMDRMITS